MVQSMRRLAKEIYAARKEGRLPAVFSSKNVSSVCPGWSKRTYAVFLPKHRAGNPGGDSELFERVAPGLYRLLGERKRIYSFKAGLEQDDDGRWSSWVDALPGCTAWGDSEGDALNALKDAVQAYIEDMIEAGEEIPNDGVQGAGVPAVAVSL